MNTNKTNSISEQTEHLLRQFLKNHPQEENSIFVTGCSSSQILGEKIGKFSSKEIGISVFTALKKVCDENKIFLACQCCEHLNRALVIEEKCARLYGYEKVLVVPHIHAGGSFATAAYQNFNKPVIVEHIKASAGFDIGSTLIGMHLKDVVVPVHFENPFIGKALTVAAYSRPKLIGGERARYE